MQDWRRDSAAALAGWARARGWSWRRHLRGRALDRLDDAVVRAAAAQVAVQRGANLALGGARILPQQRGGADQDAGNALAALHRLLGNESGLQRMRPLRAAEALDGGDVLARDRP